MKRSDLHTQLSQLLNQRILMLDGGMGTMIQARKLAEADYRGERFATGSSISKATTTCWR